MVIAIDAEKAFQKMQYRCMIKALSKPGIEVNFLSLIKYLYKKPHLTSYLMLQNSKISQKVQDQDKAVSSHNCL